MSDKIRYKRSRKPRKRPVDDSLMPQAPRTSIFGFALKTMGWIIPLFGVWLIIVTMGMPALRWQYSFHGAKAAPYYTQCDYVSFHNGVERVIPQNGSCPLIAMRPMANG